MAGRKSSFLMRARKVKEGERVEMTHLESQATGRFASLDEALSWVRAKWTEWDAQPADKEDAPAMPAERSAGMKRLWDNAWTGQGLRRGEALVLAAAVLVLAVIAGDPGVRGAVSEAFGSTQLSVVGAVPAGVAAYGSIKWSYKGETQTLTAQITSGPHSGIAGVQTLLPDPAGSTEVFCFDLDAPARAALAGQQMGTPPSETTDSILGVTSPPPDGAAWLVTSAVSGTLEVANPLGLGRVKVSFDCPSGYRDAAVVSTRDRSQNPWMRTPVTSPAGDTGGTFWIQFFK